MLVPCLILILYALAVPALGAALGYRAVVGLFFAAIVVPWVGSLLDLWATPAPERQRAGWPGVLAYWVGGTLLTLALRVPVKAWLIEAFHIPSGSMIPTLLVGDHIMVDKPVFRTRAPRRGEVIVFASPEHPEQDFVKRVLAVPGDRLEVKHGHPWINGWEVPHCLVGMASVTDTEGAVASGELHVEFLDGAAYLAFFDEKAMDPAVQGPYAVSDREIWVLGDNRYNSNDSRVWFGGRGGGLPLALVKGRALFRWLSLTKAGVDGSRFGTSLAEPLLPASMKSLEAPFQKCLADRPPRDRTLPPAAH
jgi:signal peptidase I